MRSYDQTLRLFRRYLAEKQKTDKAKKVKPEHIGLILRTSESAENIAQWQTIAWRILVGCITV